MLVVAGVAPVVIVVAAYDLIDLRAWREIGSALGCHLRLDFIVSSTGPVFLEWAVNPNNATMSEAG